MLTLKFGDEEFRKRMTARALIMRSKYVKTFFTTVATVWRASVNSAPIGRWFGGSLRRSGHVKQTSSISGDSVKAAIVFNVPYAMLVHENYSGVTIKPTSRYLYVPLTRKGAKAGQTHDYAGVKMFRDYVLPGFPGKPKPVRLRPQKAAGFLYRHAKMFWVLYRRLMEAA